MTASLLFVIVPVIHITTSTAFSKGNSSEYIFSALMHSNLYKYNYWENAN